MSNKKLNIGTFPNVSLCNDGNIIIPVILPVDNTRMDANI